MSKKDIGNFGEDLATDYLKRHGYKVLACNYIKVWDDKLKGEVDIIAKKGGVISFVEVKTQEANNAFSPEDRVDYKKQIKLKRLAQSWLLENKIPLESNWQIDVVSILIDRESKKAKIQHFKNMVADY